MLADRKIFFESVNEFNEYLKKFNNWEMSISNRLDSLIVNPAPFISWLYDNKDDII